MNRTTLPKYKEQLQNALPKSQKKSRSIHVQQNFKKNNCNGSLSVTSKMLPSGTLKQQHRVGKFTVQYHKLLGQGSFSKVYKAFVTKNKQIQFAVKVVERLKLSSELNKLIDRETEILKYISHPGIVKCQEVIEHEQRLYIFMELCNQGDLEALVDTQGRLSQRQALPIIRSVFQSLVYLSKHNIIHRDLKVANVFMHNGKAKLADFGFATFNHSKRSFQDISIGTPIYMSPEGIKHHVYGPKTDVWAFGIFIFQLVHAHTPYSHCRKQNQLKYNISTPLTWKNMRADLSPLLKELILCCLQINYEKRVSIQELLRCEPFSSILNNGYADKRSEQKSQERTSNSNYTNESFKNLIMRNTYLKVPHYQKDSIKKQFSNEKNNHSPRTDRTVKIRYNQDLVMNSSSNEKSPTTKRETLVMDKSRQPLSHYPSIQQIVPPSSCKNNHNLLLSPSSPSFKKYAALNNHQEHNSSSKRTPSTTPRRTTVNLNMINSILKAKRQQQNGKNIILQFPLSNVNSYLYLIHFSRITYKMYNCMMDNFSAEVLKQQQQQEIVQASLYFEAFMTKLLQRTHEFVTQVLYSQIQTQRSIILRQIQGTISKYQRKYTRQVNSACYEFKFDEKSFEKRCNDLEYLILKQQYQVSYKDKDEKHRQNTVKLSKILSVFLNNCEIFRSRFLSGNINEQWFEESLQSCLNKIQVDIEQIDKHYFDSKQKKKLLTRYKSNKKVYGACADKTYF